MDGILIIDKPQGFTSFDVVAKARGMLKTRKVGHAGTLDPIATGVLPLFVGRATKCMDLLPIQTKEYTAVFQLGYTTDTLDSTGTVLSRSPVESSKEDVLRALEAFRGDILQVPPMYSAIQINGQRLYDLARKGIEVEREKRPVHISQLELIASNEVAHEYTIHVACSKGTYIRTLCADIGEALGCGATMTALRRTNASGFLIGQAITLAEAQELANLGTLADRLLPIEQVFQSLPSLTLLEGRQETLYCNGAFTPVQPQQLPEDLSGDITVYSAKGEFIGLCHADPLTSRIHSTKFFRINQD